MRAASPPRCPRVNLGATGQEVTPAFYCRFMNMYRQPFKMRFTPVNHSPQLSEVTAHVKYGTLFHRVSPLRSSRVTSIRETPCEPTSSPGFYNVPLLCDESGGRGGGGVVPLGAPPGRDVEQKLHPIIPPAESAGGRRSICSPNRKLLPRHFMHLDSPPRWRCPV